MSSVPSVQQPTEAMLEVFERVYRSGVPFQEDAILGADLIHEVAPVLETLARAAGTFGAEAGPTVDPRGQSSCHEGYALLTLLGRRAGLLGATPTAAFVVLRAIVSALTGAGVQLSASLRDELNMVLLEGYCAGRDERVSAELRASVARNQVSVLLAPRCRFVALAGPFEVEALEQVLDEAAREFLRDDGVSCLLDVSRLDCQPPVRSARALLEFCLACRAVGGSVVLVGLQPELARELHELGLSERVAQLAETFGQGLTQALAHAGQEVRPLRGSWAKGLFARR